MYGKIYFKIQVKNMYVVAFEELYFTAEKRE